MRPSDLIAERVDAYFGTLASLADEAGLSTQTVRDAIEGERYTRSGERQDAQPTDRTLVKLALPLDIRPDELREVGCDRAAAQLEALLSASRKPLPLLAQPTATAARPDAPTALSEATWEQLLGELGRRVDRLASLR